jgi:hypothetical protein
MHEMLFLLKKVKCLHESFWLRDYNTFCHDVGYKRLTETMCRGSVIQCNVLDKVLLNHSPAKLTYYDNVICLSTFLVTIQKHILPEQYD